ncbi:hypothetical protein [Methylobacterium indicum]|uniref:hypothetical protein n=1 Tax=Methylobacterium indicum TaxID=1775910 RepID=UPI000A8B4DC2|nr:hypothetical protein [Methylobacterium indicum]
MDRDPIVFAWRSAKRRHAAAIAVALGLGGPLVGLGLLALRDLVDELLALAEPGRGPIHFLHLVVPLPERLGGHGLTLVRGWPLPESALTLWALGALILVALALAGLGWGVARLCVRAQAEAVRRLREVAEDAILRSGPAARDDARALAGQVGGMMGGLGGVMNTMVTRFQNSTTGIASTEQVGVSKVVNVGQTMRENVGKAHTHTVGEQYVIEVGQEMLVKVGEVFRIVVGASTLTMDKDGNVTITGKTFTTDFSDQVKHWGKVIDLNPSR